MKRKQVKQSAGEADPSVADAPVQGTRERLLHEARRILEEGGYAAASVQAIADRSGVAAGTLYRHFSSKAELFVQLVGDTARRDIEAMKAAASSGGSVERLEAIVATFARRALRRRKCIFRIQKVVF